MIIGVSGKKQSGKDTVGRIIQYLISISKDKPANGIWTFDNYVNTSDWQIKKFADKVKDIACLITGCTREQLEDEEFKNTPLGEEWKIGLLTYSDKYGYYSEYFNNKEEALEYLNDQYASYYSNYETINVTPRLLLQLVGTECGRNIIHPNIWVNALFSNYKLKTSSLLNFDYKYPNWIITDVRFPNEVKAIEDRGGILIRVNRAFDPNTHPFVETISKHPSETALDDYYFKNIINNDYSIEKLIQSVKFILTNNDLL